LKSLASVFQTASRDSLIFLYPRWFFSEATESSRIDAATSVRSLRSCTPSVLQKDLSWASREEKRKAVNRVDIEPATPSDTTTPQHEPLKLDAASLNFKRVTAIRKSRDRWNANKALSRQLKDKNLLSADWRVALDLLETHSNRFSTTEHYELHINVPREDVGRVIGRFGNTLRHLQEQSGCLIQVVRKQTDDVCFTVQITGTPQAAHKAERLVMAVVNRELWGSAGHMPIGPASTERGLDLGSSTTRQMCMSPTSNQADMDSLSRTTHRKGARRFLERVKQLTEFPVTHRRNRFFRGRAKANLERVAETISRMFSSLQSGPVITTQSVNEAMKFFVTHNLVAHARKLFADSELHYLKMDTTTFNIMLRRAAEARDLHNFTFMLGLMVKRNVRPDSRTWCTFLSVVDRKEVRDLILKKMEERNLLVDPVVVREVCRQVVSGMTADWLDSHKDPRDLLEYMGGRFTAAWYSVSAINRVLDELGKRGMMQEAWDLLVAVDARGFTFNSISVNTILTHCLRYRKGDWTVQIFHAADDRWNISPDGVTYELLFKTFWTLRLYNTARVVWRYACMDGAVSFRMRQLMKRSLQCRDALPCGTVGGRWRATAGRIIAGVNIYRASGISDPPNGKPTPTEIVERDLSTFGLWQPVRPLSTLLSEAFAVDRAWSINKGSPIVWMLQNAIDVAVKPKTAK
jgi:rRNA processing protein Krr1/Pno1